MEEKDRSAVQQLCEENARFRTLYEEHLLFEKQLQKLDQKTYLSADEEIERKKFQKLKLAGKDEMERIMKNAGIALS